MGTNTSVTEIPDIFIVVNPDMSVRNHSGFKYYDFNEAVAKAVSMINRNPDKYPNGLFILGTYGVVTVDNKIIYTKK
jgi:hypothetical protein